jgi:hypothetical protein
MEDKDLLDLATRVGKVEGAVPLILSTLDKIQNNHLVHLQAGIDALGEKNENEHRIMAKDINDQLKPIKNQVDAINLLLAKWIGGAIVALTIIQYLIKRY